MTRTSHWRRGHHPACRLVAAGLIAAAATACRDRIQPPLQVLRMEADGSLDRYVDWGATIPLEENDAVVNVLTRVSMDRDGGYLVADEQENQVRVYSPTGQLRRHFGRKGQGPKEFVFLHGAMRLGTGEVLAVDDQGKGVLFDSTGATAVQTFAAPVAPVQFVRLVNDTLVLLGGKGIPGRGRPAGTRLHLWNLRRGEVAQSFFSPPVAGRAHTLAANVGGFVGADIHRDSVAAVFALSDTIYVFGLNGNTAQPRKIPIPFQNFRLLSESRPIPGDNAGVVEAHEWVGSYSMVSDVFWLRDGGFLVQYQDREGSTPHWRLLRMRADGSRAWEVMGTPMLLAVDPRDETLIFTKPGSLTADAWRLARLKP